MQGALEQTVPPEDADILGYTVMLAAATMATQSNALLRAQAQINMRQYMALRHLRTQPDLGSAELARRLVITPQSTGSLLEGLLALGYIARGPDAPGQKFALRLTAAGERVVEIGDRLIARLEAQHRRNMGDGEAERLNGLLRKLLATLHPKAKA